MGFIDGDEVQRELWSLFAIPQDGLRSCRPGCLPRFARVHPRAPLARSLNAVQHLTPRLEYVRVLFLPLYSTSRGTDNGCHRSDEDPFYIQLDDSQLFEEPGFAINRAQDATRDCNLTILGQRTPG